MAKLHEFLRQKSDAIEIFDSLWNIKIFPQNNIELFREMFLNKIF
jgi:hypothetical protein